MIFCKNVVDLASRYMYSFTIISYFFALWFNLKMVLISTNTSQFSQLNGLILLFN